MAKKIKEPEPELSVKEKNVAIKKVVVKKTAIRKKESEALQTVADKIYPSVLLYTRFSEFDISLFKAGKHYKLHEKFGAHVINHEGVTGTYFAVWAPNAHYVSVIGDFNYWDKGTHELFVRWDHSGIWEGFIQHV